MRDEPLTGIVNGADPADEEDVLLRASLVVALCNLYADKEGFAADLDAQGTVIENESERTIDDDEHDADSTPVAFPPPRAARAPRCTDWAIAASLAVVLLGGGYMWGSTPSERDELVEEVAGYHEVYSRETTYLVEVPASKTEQLTTWLGQRLDREIKVPDLVDAGLHFAGGRLLVVNDRPVAELMYTRDEGLPIAICISRIGGKPWSMDVEQHDALRIASWAKDGYAYIVVGELDDAAAKDLAQRVEGRI
jgi:anti-sigma factor RsiW